MPETAQKKFLDPHPDVQREALQSLWGAWERLRTAYNPNGDKKNGIKSLLDVAAVDKLPNASISACNVLQSSKLHRK